MFQFIAIHPLCQPSCLKGIVGTKIPRRPQARPLTSLLVLLQPKPHRRFPLRLLPRRKTQQSTKTLLAGTAPQPGGGGRKVRNHLAIAPHLQKFALEQNTTLPPSSSTALPGPSPPTTSTRCPRSTDHPHGGDAEGRWSQLQVSGCAHRPLRPRPARPPWSSGDPCRPRRAAPTHGQNQVKKNPSSGPGRGGGKRRVGLRWALKSKSFGCNGAGDDDTPNKNHSRGPQTQGYLGTPIIFRIKSYSRELARCLSQLFVKSWEQEKYKSILLVKKK